MWAHGLRRTACGDKMGTRRLRQNPIVSGPVMWFSPKWQVGSRRGGLYARLRGCTKLGATMISKNLNEIQSLLTVRLAPKAMRLSENETDISLSYSYVKR